MMALLPALSGLPTAATPVPTPGSADVSVSFNDPMAGLLVLALFLFVTVGVVIIWRSMNKSLKRVSVPPDPPRRRRRPPGSGGAAPSAPTGPTSDSTT